MNLVGKYGLLTTRGSRTRVMRVGVLATWPAVIPVEEGCRDGVYLDTVSLVAWLTRSLLLLLAPLVQLARQHFLELKLHIDTTIFIDAILSTVVRAGCSRGSSHSRRNDLLGSNCERFVSSLVRILRRVQRGPKHML